MMLCKQVHNLAQLSHCCAQGKIGSGFDVAAAVYGTMQYVRFSPQVIEQKDKRAETHAVGRRLVAVGGLGLVDLFG